MTHIVNKNKNKMDSANGKRGSTLIRLPRNTRRKKSICYSKRASKVSPDVPLPKETPQRVFLYMKLNSIVNLPVAPYPLELHLYHVQQTLQKMSEHYTTETIIYSHEFEMERPAFAMGIIQDSIDDLNVFSDNPLVVSLYQRIPRHRRKELKTVTEVRTETSIMRVSTKKKQKVKMSSDPDHYVSSEGQHSTHIVDMAAEAWGNASGDGVATLGEACDEEDDDDFVEERLEFLSRGHCDLLQLFQCKRFIANIPIMLYAEYDRMLETTTSQKITTTSEWHMYSILPILKKFHFTNLVFVTLESIYNAPEELHQRAGHLGINISIRSTEPDPDLDMEYQVIPFCTFYGFISQIIGYQNTIIVWESIKRDLLNDSRCKSSNNQMETSAYIKLPRLLRDLLTTPGVDMKIDEINQFADYALINNSLHRYVMTTDMREVLESAVLHNQYELLLQLYDETPDNVLYEGVINPSVFGYPEVTSCRFASVLSPVVRKTERKTNRLTESSEPESIMFSIIKICFFQPLTKRNERLDVFNENQMKCAKLRLCMGPEFPNESLKSRDIIKELYRNFDELIKELISFMVKNDVTSIEDKPHNFCCHLNNLRNLLVDICGSDFNVRMPTKTNLEFREMLTHMHKELMERIEGLLIACSWESLSNCVLNYDNECTRTIRLMEEYRNMCIMGECAMAKQIFNELKSSCNAKILLNFYVFLTSVENLNFEQATNYLRHQKESNWSGEYFVCLLELYVNYKMHLKVEENEGEAYSNLLEQLRIFSIQNNLDREVYVLLYCYYKQKNYLPGMEFTRWQYENLYDVPRKIMPLIPRSLYQSFIPIDFQMRGQLMHAHRFYEVFKTFACLGAYGFAEIIFAEIASEFTTIEAYLITTTLKILQGEIDKNFVVKRITTDNTVFGKMLGYYQAHINGSVEYSRRRYDEAIKHYRDLLSINLTEDETRFIFYTSLMRLARLSFEREDYELAAQAYEMCTPYSKRDKNFVANYGRGLTLYYQNKLEDAIEYLSRSTDNDIFVPDPWGYLAVINLRLNRNKSALDCWKHPEMPLNNRIYEELEKIKYSDVCLLVEDDCMMI
ncbi:uncharacterized protein LOC117565268 isoform X2 [Drosophila albomicans]|uniref:Uncharacterized protein LOC117565268 isoform X2 n=1 Tax=Drosophila albomicans TaxID=7291 RepID=A0A9C6SS70_DROAB|nr:uncharacterized protein LOC117565268 isoform X2 [Drosophila albomicans]